MTLSAERRRRLLEIADEWNIHIIEDDVYGRAAIGARQQSSRFV